MKKVSLDEAVGSILDAVTTKLRDETATGKALEGVNGVISGKSRNKPQLPSLWVYLGEAKSEGKPVTLAETWRMPIVIIALTKDDEPENSYKESAKLAAKARSLIMKDRTLGLRDYVQDMNGGTFNANRDMDTNKTISGAAASVDVIFLTM